MDFPCELLLENIAANVFIVKVDAEAEKIVDIYFIKHTSFSEYSEDFFKDEKKFFSVLDKESLTLIKKHIRKVKTENTAEFIIKIKSKRGKFLFLNLHFSVIKREENIVTVVGYSEEVTQREELKNITKKIFEFKELGVLIFQENVVFSNYLIKKVFDIKDSNIKKIFSKNPGILNAIPKRLDGEDFNIFRQEYEFIINDRRIYGDYFCTTILFNGKYSGLILFLDKTLKVKKDKFLKILNNIYSLHLNCKKIEVFLNSAVEFIKKEGFFAYIKYENKEFGEKRDFRSVYEIDEDGFYFMIASEYKNEFYGIEEIVKELFFVLKNSIDVIINNKNLLLLKNSFEESFQVVVITDEEFNIIYSNKIFRELIKGDIKNLKEVFINIDSDNVINEKILIGKKNGNKIFLKSKIIPVEYDKTYYVVQGIVLDENYSVMDSLTNLLNREGFLKESSLNSKKALVVLDIYEFKSIIETKGKEYANEILKNLAAFLQEEVSYIDLGRVGGDEFAFLLDLDRLDTSLEDFIEKLIRDITSKLNIHVNVGIAIANDNLNNLEILLEKAYIALHHSVKKGVNTFEIYNEFIANQKRKFFKVQTLIKKAIENREFVFYFQPYVEAKTFKIKGVESLLRIKEGENIVLPCEFIDVAEESGLISEIEKITFPLAVDYAKKLPVNLSYNLSAHTFINDGFYKSLPKVENLVIEITERILRDVEISRQRIFQIKKRGIKVAIDDFGTGYSNFVSLKELDFDILKIDMGFVKNIQNSKKDIAIVKSIIEFAKTVGLKTVAEGVESKDQVEILQNLGCDCLQGFYFYKPMPFDELKKILGGENGKL